MRFFPHTEHMSEVSLFNVIIATHLVMGTLDLAVINWVLKTKTDV